MIVLQPISTEQVVGVIPREILLVDDVYLTLTDNTTGEVFEDTGLIAEYSGDLLKCKFTLTPTIKDDRFYSLLIGSILQRDSVSDDSYIVYKDLVFCTSQETYQPNHNTYNINKGVYKEQQTSNNDYIVL
tara:strand:- start:2917 stop:3306 length:390 start_codon:yes stop_codon:yes gene_type:complete